MQHDERTRNETEQLIFNYYQNINREEVKNRERSGKYLISLFLTSSLFWFWCKEFSIIILIILLIVYILGKSKHLTRLIAVNFPACLNGLLCLTNFSICFADDLEKRSTGANKWSNMQGAWGKRGDANSPIADIRGILAKRPSAKNWGTLQTAWGKRYNSLRGSWGKRSRNYSSLRGSWGKRASDSPVGSGEKRASYSSLRGSWGKRSNPARFSSLRGSWGKRSNPRNYSSLRGSWGKRSNYSSLRGSWGKRAAPELTPPHPEEKRGNSLRGSWGKRNPTNVMTD